MRAVPAACLGLLASIGAAAAQQGPEASLPAEPGRITVLGHAAVEVPPDFATVQIGVASKAASAGAALADNSAAVARTIALAKGLGIGDADIATSAVALAPAYRNIRGPNGSEQQPDGYGASNTVSVRLADMRRLGEFMRQAVEGGANRIDGVSFGLRDPGRVDREASAAATRDALERARAVAEAAGVGLGSIERIAAPPRAERPMMPGPQLRALAAAPRGNAVPIEAGTLTVAAEVEIVWRLKGP